MDKISVFKCTAKSFRRGPFWLFSGKGMTFTWEWWGCRGGPGRAAGSSGQWFPLCGLDHCSQRNPSLSAGTCKQSVFMEKALCY